MLLHRVLTSSKIELVLEKNIKNIGDYIKEKHRNYLMNGPSVVTDVIYSVEVCLNVSAYIMHQLAMNNLRQIA